MPQRLAPLGRPMKRALSIASVALVAAFVAGAMFLLPATLPPEVIERSVVREQTMLKKARHLPVASDSTATWTSNRTSPYAGRQALLTFFVLWARQQTPRRRFLLIRQSAGRASASLDYPSTNSPT